MSLVRIIAGAAHGRALNVPPSARPTPALVRKALFDTLASAAPNAADFLDLYAGSGAVGFEAASRGYDVTLVEQDPMALRALNQNRARLGLHAVVVRGDALAVMRGRLVGPNAAFDVVFLDPPFNRPLPAVVSAALNAGSLLRMGGLLVVQLPSSAPPPGDSRWATRSRTYGSNSLHYLTPASD